MTILTKEKLEELPLHVQDAYKGIILNMKSKEIDKLSIEEQKQYYEEYRRLVLERKLTNTTPGALTIVPMFKSVSKFAAKGLIKFFTTKDTEIIVRGTENIPDGPVIYARTHQGLLDNFKWIPEVSEPALILHGDKVKKILVHSQTITGLVLVDKDSKESNHNAKLDMCNLLWNSLSLNVFPESTYNLSPNKLHLPMKYGIMDIAKKTGVPIVPVVHEYEYQYDKEGKKLEISKAYSIYGEPIYVSREDSLSDKLEELSTQFSTIRFGLIESRGTFKREEISEQEYIDFLKMNYKDLDFAGLSIEHERSHIFQANDPLYTDMEFFINDIPFTEEGNLIEPGQFINRKVLSKTCTKAFPNFKK